MTAILITNPRVVVKLKFKNSDKVDYADEQLTGKFYKVIPDSAEEIYAIQDLPRGEKYAFAANCGEGICLTQKGYEHLVELVLARISNHKPHQQQCM